MRELIIDLFAGGGGASTGIEKALGFPVDIAVNHDPEAIEMHRTNHSNTLHLVEDVFAVFGIPSIKSTRGILIRGYGLIHSKGYRRNQ
jgi:site-specific DNA-cytosine methylase